MCADRHDLFQECSPTDCISCYGMHMTPSALADWVELYALRGRRTPWPALANALKDSGLASGLIDSRELEDERYGFNYLGIDDPDCEEFGNEPDDETSAFEDQPEQLSAYEILEQRSSLLDESYPFEFDRNDCLSLKEGYPVSSSSYIWLLKISLMKGWIYPKDQSILLPITRLFEYVVSLALRMGGLSAEVVGTAGGSGFMERVGRCTQALNLPFRPQGLSIPNNAQDMGVDVLGGYLWDDYRVGENIWLVQAACGKEEAWEDKSMHIDSAKWGRLLGDDYCVPLSLIAVPYHMTNDAVRDVLHYSESRSFLDRIRLVIMMGKVVNFKENYQGASRAQALEDCETVSDLVRSSLGV